MTKLLALAALLAAGTITGAPTAGAERVRSVSPGDDIVTTAAEGGQRCTLGYTFTNPAGRTYGITAGHCNRHRSNSVTDRTTGAVGRFVLAVGHPDRALEDDYGLIDFGTARSTASLAGIPVTGISAPVRGRPICHDGVRTGRACGTLHGRLTATQYATSGMPASIPGDSGGPVWQLNPDRSATVVGIWLGEREDTDGQRYGRFTGLVDVLADIADAGGLTTTT